MEYEHLARGLKNALLEDATALDADKLAQVSASTVASWFHPFTPPQLDERVRKVQEVGAVLQRGYDGLALNLIRQANASAVEAVRLVLANFPGTVCWICSLSLFRIYRHGLSVALCGQVSGIMQCIEESRCISTSARKSWSAMCGRHTDGAPAASHPSTTLAS